MSVGSDLTSPLLDRIITPAATPAATPTATPTAADDVDLSCRALDPIRYLVKLDQNVGYLRKEMEGLKTLRDDVKKRVDVAEEQGYLRCTDQVKEWLQQVDAMEGESNGIEQSYFNQSRMRCLGNCWLTYKLGKRVKKKLRDVSELMSNGVFDIVAEGSRPDVVVEMPSSSSGASIVGMDLRLKKALNFIREESVGIIGIYGMAGVGKTTLLRTINNALLHGNWDFDVAIWVVVSRNVNLEKIQMDIGNRLGLSFPENASLEAKATHLLKVLKKKKYLLLLDDLWEGLDLDKIGVPSPKNQHNCKIVFTTRIMGVCTCMGANRIVRVDVLCEKEAWELFKGTVGEEGVRDSPLIQTIAMNITKQCGGLPIALVTIGRAMVNMTSLKEWKHTQNMLHISPTMLPGVQDQIFNLLKFSYDNLADDRLKLCFLYCSLFPEDHNINIQSLIECWMGEGFLDKCVDIYEARDKGHVIIKALKNACLLETGWYEVEVKMHSIIREFALWIAHGCGKKENKFLVQAGVGLNDAPRVETWKEAERISLMFNDIKALKETPTCPNLLTFIIKNNLTLNEVCEGFFRFMPLIRVLDLSMTNIRELPAEIGNLNELQYLNLSNTKITMLPNELGNLVKLKHLDLSFTFYLKKIPREFIEGHSSLQVLNVYESRYHVNLAELDRCRRLNAFGITINTLFHMSMLLDSETLPERTHWLAFRICSCLSRIHLSSSYLRMKRLQYFGIRECDELEELIIGEEDYLLLPSLELFILSFLPKLKVIVVLSHNYLRNLHRLCISGCPELKNITWIVRLVNLEHLEVIDCNAMEEVIGGGAEVAKGELAALISLKLLKIKRLPNLKSIYCRSLAFPSLKVLEVNECPKLRKLPFSRDSAKNTLQMIRGHKTWWDGLRWEYNTIKSVFLPYFVEVEEEEEYDTIKFMKKKNKGKEVA